MPSKKRKAVGTTSDRNVSARTESAAGAPVAAVLSAVPVPASAPGFFSSPIVWTKSHLDITWRERELSRREAALTARDAAAVADLKAREAAFVAMKKEREQEWTDFMEREREQLKKIQVEVSALRVERSTLERELAPLRARNSALKATGDSMTAGIASEIGAALRPSIDGLRAETQSGFVNLSQWAKNTSEQLTTSTHRLAAAIASESAAVSDSIVRAGQHLETVVVSQGAATRATVGDSVARAPSSVSNTQYNTDLSGATFWVQLNNQSSSGRALVAKRR